MRSWLGPSLVAVVLFPAPASASIRTDAEVFAQAEAAFRQGVEHETRILQARKYFSEAADGYRELHQRGLRSPRLYVNLGNAALLADRWPEAIWAYQVGLKLDPNDRVLLGHLAFARTKVLYPPAGQGRLYANAWPGWLHRPTIYELCCTLAFSYLMSWIFATGAFISRQARLYRLTAALILVSAGLGGGLWYELRQDSIDRRTPLVILADNTGFYRGNADSYPQHSVLPVLPRGLEVRQLNRRGDWLQVRLSTGEIGWVHAGNAFIVEP